MPQNPLAKLDYDALLQRHPWVVESGQNCVLSPDSDGLLCGLLMSHYLDWKIRGFYDGKILAIKRGISPHDCIFLDMEIFRPNIRSIGQHMIMYDKKDLPRNWTNFSNCISVNNLRNYDFKNDFKLKYPFGTIHVLLSVLSRIQDVSVPKSAVSPLLYADGTFKNQFNYPDNCLSWLDFLGANSAGNPLQKVFLDRHYSTHELMVEMSDLFSRINAINGGRRGGDRIKISDSRGSVVNVDDKANYLEPETRGRAETFLKMLANKTGWTFIPASWAWGPYQIARLKKGNTKPSKTRYGALLAKNPASLAIISRNSIEYSIDEGGVF